MKQTFRCTLSKFFDLRFCTFIFNIPLSFAALDLLHGGFHLFHLEGDIGVNDIAVLGFFSCGISVILILTCGIDLVTIFNAVLTSRQTREKLQCLYENLMSNIFRKMAVLEKNINCKLKLQSKGLS